MNTVKVKALVKNIKRERPDLAEHFSEHALTEIAKEAIANSCFAGYINSLTIECIASMENQFKTRIAAFIQHENEVMNLVAEMQEITKQKPVLCLESHTVLFRRALDCILESYSKGGYSDEDIQREYCPDATDVAVYKMRYKFTGSYKYRTSYCEDDGVTGNNVCNAIDAAWNWFHTCFVNNFISKDPETNLLHLNW